MTETIINGKRFDSLQAFKSYGTGVINLIMDGVVYRIQLDELLKLIQEHDWEVFTPPKASYPYIKRVS